VRPQCFVTGESREFTCARGKKEAHNPRGGFLGSESRSRAEKRKTLKSSGKRCLKGKSKSDCRGKNEEVLTENLRGYTERRNSKKGSEQGHIWRAQTAKGGEPGQRRTELQAMPGTIKTNAKRRG